MAPLRSLIHHELDSKRERTVSFFYGARSRSDVLYTEEFTILEQQHQRFDWTVALSEPTAEDDWTGPLGFIHAVIVKLVTFVMPKLDMTT